MKTILLSLALLIAIGLSAQTPATIYEIQGQVDESPMFGQIIETTGIVTGMNRDNGFFMQDGTTGWNGILVYYPEMTETINLGDEVTVVGLVDEYYEMTELKEISSITVVSTGNTVPAPITLTGDAYADEQYESMLINCQDAECTDVSSQYGEYVFNDGTGNIITNDGLWSYTTEGEEVLVGSTYQITGIVQYDHDEYKILPRDASDLVEGELGIYDSHISGLEIYPNPVTNNVVYITAKNNIASVNVFNMVGQSVKRINANDSQLTVDISDLRNGMYILKIESSNGNTNTQKIIVK